jgi:hypothetical protein
MEKNENSRAVFRSIATCLVLLLFGAIVATSALAFPTVATTVNAVLTGAGPQTEYITINGSSEHVYMGPYNIYVSPVNEPQNSFVAAMMCFNAAASAPTSPSLFLVADTALATIVYGNTALAHEKIQMIAWLTTKWDTTNPTAYNANINKAMWEIMADYDGTRNSLNAAPVNSPTGFHLTFTDNGSVSYFLDQAWNHRSGDAQGDTQANFLIPGSRVGDTWTIDPNIQPFVQPVPEPGTLLLLGSGLTGLGLFGWRKRARAKR